MRSNYGAAVSLFRFAFYVYRHSGRTGDVPVTIGIAPLPMMMAGRSHCLRRFYHARTVTERKFHYIQMIATEPPRIYWTLLCRRHWCFSLPFHYAEIHHLLPRKERSWRTRHPAPCMPLLAVCIRLVLYSIFKVQRRIKNISLINLFIFGAKVSDLRETFSEIFPCF